MEINDLYSTITKHKTSILILLFFVSFAFFLPCIEELLEMNKALFGFLSSSASPRFSLSLTLFVVNKTFLIKLNSFLNIRFYIFIETIDH